MSKYDFFLNSDDEGTDFPLVRLFGFKPKRIKPASLPPKEKKENAKELNILRKE